MDQKTRILLIEDDYVDRKIVKRLFRNHILQKYQLEEATNIKTGIEMIYSFNPHLLMLDLSLPDSKNDEGFNIINEMFPEIPVVILTGLSDKSLSVHMIRNGAQDYLIKNEFDVILLEKSINYAIERQRLIQQKRDAEEKIITTIMETENRERSRIAKELHDSLGQQLTAMLFALNTLKKSIKDTIEGDKLSQIDKIIKQMNTAIEETRVISHNLMPESVRDFGFSNAVMALLEDLENNVAVNFHFNTNFQSRLNPQIEVSLYRITQEAINNALKYAQAKNISIQLMKFHDEITLSIEDDGYGFDPNNVDKKKSFGIESMRYRVSACNGTMELDTLPNKGTCLTFHLPNHVLAENNI